MPADSKYIGSWTSAKYKAAGLELSAEDVGVSVLELNKNGKATFTFMGEGGSGKWQESADGVDVKSGSSTLAFKFIENQLVLDYSGVQMFFVKDGTDDSITNPVLPGEGSPAPQSAAPSQTEAPKPEVGGDALKFWNQSFYGWWMMDTETATGSYKEMEPNWWDCCAEMSMDETGFGKVVVWDEDLSKDDGVAEFKIKVNTNSDASEVGEATSVAADDNFFMDAVGTPIDGELTFSPANTKFNNFIMIKGHYSDSDGSYDYYVYLRPWGEKWDDIEAADKDMMPFYYKDWYLPQLEKGVSVAPDKLDFDSK